MNKNDYENSDYKDMDYKAASINDTDYKSPVKSDTGKDRWKKEERYHDVWNPPIILEQSLIFPYVVIDRATTTGSLVFG